MVVPAAAGDAEDAVVDELPPRVKLCGRCRTPHDCDPAEQESPGVTFWLCPECHTRLLGGTGRGRSQA
jgi:hypothetical protein